MPEKIPSVTIYAGDTTVFGTYTFVRNGVLIDLVADGWTGWQAHWKTSPKAENHVSLTVDSTQAASGKITVSVTAANSRNLTGTGYWDLQATRTSETKTWVYGNTTFVEDVTR